MANTYETYKDSGIAWIGEIPSEWKVKPHKRIMRKIKDIQEHYNGEDIISLTMNGVIIRDLDAGGKMPASFDGYQKLYPGNLLQCLFDIDVTPRCVGLIKDEGLSSPAYSQFEMIGDIDASYYDYLLRYMDDHKTLLHLSKNLRSSLTESEFGQIASIVPTRKEQQSIATFLDKKCGEIDSLIAMQEEMISELQVYKQSVITEAVTKGLNPNAKMKDSGIEWIGEIPESWDVSRIKNICIFSPSDDKSYQYDSVGYAPMNTVRFGSINAGIIDKEKLTSGLTYFADGDIVMAKVTPCFENGNIAIAKDLHNGCAYGSSELFVFRATNILKEYFFYALQNEKFKGLCCATMTGTGGLKRVSPSFVYNCSIALPNKEEQKQIVGYLDAKTQQIDSLIAIKLEKILELKDYKKSIIYEYVTGKKRV